MRIRAARAALAIGVLAAPLGAAALTCNHPAGGIQVPLVGDLTSSGQVNVADAVCAILCTLAVQSSQPLSSVPCLAAPPQAADPNCDGVPTIVDIGAVVALSLGAPLPAGLAPGGDGCPTACASCATGGEGSCLIGGACYANGGVNPVSKKRVVKEENVPPILAEMCMSGLYDSTGDWMYKAGLPAKSGVGGGLVAVAPGKLAMAAFSPPLDPAGNTVKGQAALQSIIRELNLNLFRS